MQTILKKVNNVMVIEKSRFITLLYPVHTRNEALEILEEVKQEYANATHYCYAYIMMVMLGLVMMVNQVRPLEHQF